MSSFSVEQRRGHVTEAVHRVHACATDPQGRLLWQVGADLVTTFRSAAKPFQLEVSWSRLPSALQARLDVDDLALGGASHQGEPVHVAGLERLLAKLGCERRHLLCGAHEPSHPEAARALAARGEAASVLHNNCAGKHAFMAAASAACGEPEDYRPSGHPLQRAVAENLARRAEYSALTSVVDGCGAPCFVLPLSAMARCYAQLAQATADPASGVLGDIGRAYLARPLLMSGSTAFDGWLNQQGGVVAKVGAQGLLCVALPAYAVGVAIKIESGVDLARAPAVHALLTRAYPGLLPELPPAFRDVRNVVGDKVGEVCAVDEQAQGACAEGENGVGATS